MTPKGSAAGLGDLSPFYPLDYGWCRSEHPLFVTNIPHNVFCDGPWRNRNLAAFAENKIRRPWLASKAALTAAYASDLLVDNFKRITIRIKITIRRKRFSSYS